MRFSPSSEEQTALQTLSLEVRFHYAISRFCECEEVWGLGDDSGWLIRDVDDKAVITIWPYRQMAEECVQGEWSDSEPVSVSLEHFLYQLLKQCQENEITMEVCPVPGKTGFMLSAAQLHEVLDNIVETDTYFIEG